MKSIAVTGTIGSGKSACSQILRDMGFYVFDCDQVSHSYIKKNGLLYHQVIELLSKKILDDDGNIDRRKVASVVFDDVQLKKQYEKMFHDALRIEICEQMTQHKLFFAEVPLLFETGFDELFDESWLVICDEETAVHRCCDHRGMKKEDVLLRMKHQMSTEEKIRRSDVVLDNSSTIEHLKKQIEEVLKGMNGYGTACENSLSD